MLTITRDDPLFRPVTIRIESQDDLDKLLAIIRAVAENRINHTPQIIRAAMDFRRDLLNTINED